VSTGETSNSGNKKKVPDSAARRKHKYIVTEIGRRGVQNYIASANQRGVLGQYQTLGFVVLERDQVVKRRKGNFMRGKECSQKGGHLPAREKQHDDASVFFG